jgi:Ca2+/Na+ antiporter
LYVWDYKIPALLLFFFFLTSGFNLVPEKMTQLAFFSKGSDYAIIMLFVIVVIDAFCIKSYLKFDRLIHLYLLFCIFLVICIFYNKFIIGVGWSEIIRTCRYHFLWVAYLVFRRLSKKQLESLLKYLFVVTFFCSILYLFQIILDVYILNESVKSEVELFGMKIPRYYNHPDMLHFFVLMAIFYNPFKGIAKYVTTGILVIALLGAFHRSLIGSFFLVLALGYILQLPRLKRVKVLSVVFVFLIFLVAFAGYKFVHSRTYVDIQRVISGNLADTEIDVEDLQQSTFSFRILHLLERNQYLSDNPKAMLMGAGLMTEDSKLTFSMFDFDVGLLEELSGQTNQLDTGDISYSILLLRYGYLGTVLNLALFIYLIVVFYKKRENKYAFFSFLYFIMSIITSFFSANLVLPITFVLPLISYCIIHKTEKPVLK